MPLPDSIVKRIEKIEEKYGTIGQDIESYLDGLLYSNSLTYWDYIHLDTLLSIQNTRTDLHDEKIFLTYHQITELYFSLMLHELDVLCVAPSLDYDMWLEKLTRINRYFEALVDSFEIVIKGLNKHEFLKFRMSLLPSSGFQSAQYRKIEINCTSLDNLVRPEFRKEMKSASLEACYEKLYWKYGNLSLKTGQKTLTLQQFEKRYDEELLDLANKRQDTNIWAQVQKWPKQLKEDEPLQEALKTLDHMANMAWPRSHLKAAIYHLHQEPEVLKATGGTNWQEYLPPKKQSIHFFSKD